VGEVNEVIKTGVKYAIPGIIRQQVQPRKIHAFCLGTPKSGTTSLAGMFRANYRADHEPERASIVDAMHAHYNGQLSDEALCQYLKKRDKRLWLEIESNCFLGYRPDLLYRVYPHAKYILTVREPESWLGSIFDNNVNFPRTDSHTVRDWHDVFFEPHKFDYGPYEKALRDHKLYPLDAYINYWVNANQSAHKAIPGEQLLILGTKEIRQNVDLIADFLEVSVDSLVAGKSHLHKTRRKHGVLDLLDPTYIKDRLESGCGELYASLQSAHDLAIAENALPN
jgi:hypothetical protein